MGDVLTFRPRTAPVVDPDRLLPNTLDNARIIIRLAAAWGVDLRMLLALSQGKAGAAPPPPPAADPNRPKSRRKKKHPP